MAATGGRRFRLPARLAPVVFGLLVSGLMSLVVSGVSTANARGVGDGFVSYWLGAWVFSWAVAFPTILVIAPAVRRMVQRLVDG